MQRYVPLDKAVNFRDLGGYKTTDGRTVKWKRLFRCGQLAMLTDEDVARLAALEISLVFDFRTPREHKRDPSRVPATAVTHQLEIWPGAADGFEPLVREVTPGGLNDAACIDIQKRMYQEIITDFGHRYAAMFQLMDEAQGRPMVMHCSAGKDRTGVGAALVLLALGVPEQTIKEDYLLTNNCARMRGIVQGLVEKGIAGNDPAVSDDAKFARLMDLFSTHGDYMQAAFDTMREKSGSTDAYLREDLGMTDEKRARLKDWFLEMPAD